MCGSGRSRIGRVSLTSGWSVKPSDHPLDDLLAKRDQDEIADCELTFQLGGEVVMEDPGSGGDIDGDFEVLGHGFGRLRFQDRLRSTARAP